MIRKQGETIHRVKNKTSNFTIVLNEVFRRSDLSARAKGIYAYIMTLPDDWLICKQELYTHFAEGKAALDTGFAELESAGYVNKRLLRDGHGHITATEYTVYESAEMNDLPKSENRKTVPPKADLPLSGEPLSVNRMLLNTDLTKDLEESNTENNKKRSSSSIGPSKSEIQPPSETTTKFVSECKKHGYFISENTACKILDIGLDPTWLSGEFTFPEYIAQYVVEKYGDKPHGQLTSIFIKAMGYADRREEYQALRKQRIRDVVEKAGQEWPEAEADKTLSDHFIRRWQQNADIFNCVARLKRPKDWQAFWEQNTMTLEKIDLAIDNFIEGVKTGAIERRFIPSSPDGFVLNGWITRSLSQFKKPGQGHRIANDNVADEDIDKYFREA